MKARAAACMLVAGIAWCLLSCGASQDASSLGGKEKAGLVRSLIQEAIEARDDPDKAEQLLIRAAEIAKTVPAPYIAELSVEFDAREHSIGHFRVTKTTPVEKETVLSPHLKLLEKSEIQECCFSAMVDNNKGVLLPFPMKGEVLKEKILLRDEIAVHSSGARTSTSPRVKKYHPSPDECYVLLEDGLHAKPMEILDLNTGSITKVEAPGGLEKHYYVYPFGFERWDKDSRTFTVQVGFTTYREIWQVGAQTGRASRLERKPYETRKGK